MPASASAGLLELARRIDPGIGAVSVGGASDGNFTAAIGVPTLDGLGAVGGGAHADHEYVVVSTMPERARLLAGIIEAVIAG
jgi:glutamate carboxypeptidase